MINNIEWQHIRGSPRFHYPIDYWVAVISANEETGQIDFLSKWEPHSYCHYHRHLGPTTTLVLEGEHHVVTPSQGNHVDVRTRGFFSNSPGGEQHMESGGPSGAVVLFSCQAIEGGKLFDVLDDDGNVLATATINDFITGKIKG